MSPQRKTRPLPRDPKSHATSRHEAARARPARDAAPRGHPHMAYISTLAALGWRVTKIYPEGQEENALWHVSIERVDLVAYMTAVAPDPDMALRELIRYVAVDADEPG